MTAQQVAVKKYVVKLRAEEREQLNTLIRTGKHRARQLRKARILLKADVSEAGEGWSDSQIAIALDTTVNTVARTRQRLGGARVRSGADPQAFASLGQTVHLRRSGRGQAVCAGLFRATQKPAPSEGWGVRAVDAEVAGNGSRGTEHRRACER